MISINRRAMVCGMLASAGARAARVRERLPPWRPGTLDIHHIATNAGDATLLVTPDGTTILIDAGATSESGPAVLPLRPNSKRRAGEWIARYIQRRLLDTGRSSLDFLVITHLHPDHINAVADVASAMEIGQLIDSDYPQYGFPPFEDAAASEQYIAYVMTRARRGESVSRFRVGAIDQIGLQHGSSSMPFTIRNLAAKGVVWTGRNEDTVSHFPHDEVPNVNAGSIALLLRFGAFKYFCAGDLTDWADAGTRPWMDALTPAAKLAGPVDVAVTPHHGLFDSTGSAMVRSLAARTWIISTWHASHPSITTLERLFNSRLFPGERNVYATGLSAAADLTAHRLTQRLASSEGHVIVRVTDDGMSYRVFVTSNRDESDSITHVSALTSCHAAKDPTVGQPYFD